MTVQDLMDALGEMDRDAEVKLAIQPTWAFQHSIGEVVEIEPDIPGLEWGVQVHYLDEEKEWDFEMPEANTYNSADELRGDLAIPAERMKENGIKSVNLAASYKGEIISEERAEELAMDVQPVVYIAEAGQDCYLPEAAQETLGWSRR